MKITLINEQRAFLLDEKKIKKVILDFLKMEKISTDEVIVHFVRPSKIKKLHKHYFADPKVTDCISFPISGKENEAYHILGEIFICPAFAKEYLKTKKKEVVAKEINKEVVLYLIHGLLHLIGYDDIHAFDRKLMRKQESLHMKKLFKIYNFF